MYVKATSYDFNISLNKHKIPFCLGIRRDCSDLIYTQSAYDIVAFHMPN